MRALTVSVLVSLLLASIASADMVRASFCCKSDNVEAIRDGVEPKSPFDVPRHSFWPHKGTKEWVEYHFDEPKRVSTTEVYWLDDTPDTPAGQCKAPVSWRLLYRKGEAWAPVEEPSAFGVAKGVFNRVDFKEVETTALRMELQIQQDWSCGIIEWDVQHARIVKRQLAPLTDVYFAPRDTALLDTVRRSKGFSNEATAYLATLADYGTRFKEARGRIESGAGVPEAERQQLVNAVQGHIRRPVKQLPPIAFFTRFPLARPNAANCAIWQSVPERWGCSIQTMDPARPEVAPRTIFSDPEGSIYDMNLSYDGKTLFFSYRKKPEPCWQIYEIGVDGQGLKKICRDPKYHEVGAAELPSGDLVYVSTRREGFTVCQPGPTSNLYTMKRDGSAVRCVSQNTLSDFSPQMLEDGRVLFTRWEYIDRDLTYRQSLWTQNPDGRRYQLFFGNTVRDVGTFWQSRPVPGQTHLNLLVSTFAPHHGWPHGAIGFIQNRLGVEAPKDAGFTYITREIDTIQDISHRWAYRDPFPMSDYSFLVANGEGGRFGLYLLDLCGNKTLLHREQEAGCYGPLPLQPSPVPRGIVAMDRKEDGTDRKEEWGTVMLVDVYEGVPEIERGRIKYIQVMEQMRKMYDLTTRAFDQSPAMSYATYYAKKVWGRVPVEADGSAHFEVPALREVYFQVLDAEGRELQRMTSALQVMPGEQLSCIGCHESRMAAPPQGLSRMPAAFRRKADRLVKPGWETDGVVDFVKVVQPVLDTYCVKCHSGPDPKGGYNFSGHKTRIFNMAYDNLLGRSKSYRQHDMQTGDLLPDEAKKGKPLVHFYWLLRTPTAVNRPFQTGSHASRLLDFIESEHCGQKIPLADRQRIYTWIDANVPYYATYENSRPRSPGYRDLCTDVATGKPSEWYAKRFRPLFDQKCATCHGPIPEPNDHAHIWEGRFAWMDFTQPEHSPALAAHLAKAAGGRGLGTEPGGKGAPLFPGTAHPDYQAMLSALKEGQANMEAHPRVDMVAKR